IFEQKKDQLLMNARLLNDANNLIVSKLNGTTDEKLQGRILSVSFLLDQLPDDLPGGRPKSDKQSLADLLINDLTGSSDDLRRQVDAAVEALVKEGQLMSIGDEYKLQTKAGQEWEQAYQGQVQKLTNQGEDKIQNQRSQRIYTYIKN